MLKIHIQNIALLSRPTLAFFGFMLLSVQIFGEEGLESQRKFADDEPSSNWNMNIEGFVPAYFDKGRNAFAINTVKQPTDQWAAATRIFQQKAGIYTVIFTSLLETDGECSYKLTIDGKEILSFQNPKIYGSNTPEYAPHKMEVKNVKIKKDAVIRVEFLSNSNGLVPENDAFGYARARWQEIIFMLQE